MFSDRLVLKVYGQGRELKWHTDISAEVYGTIHIKTIIYFIPNTKPVRRQIMLNKNTVIMVSSISYVKAIFVHFHKWN